VYRAGHQRRSFLRRAQISVAICRRFDALRRHVDLEHHLRPGTGPVSRGLPMSLSRGPRFQPHGLLRRLLGPIFGAACLAATCTGVVVLIILLGSIVMAALKGPPDPPWYAIGSNLSELFSLIRRLSAGGQSSNPLIAGYRVGIAG